jgi:DNA-binding NarL/FixJ family response regulator
VTALTRLGVFTVLRKEVFRRSAFRQAVHQALASMPGGISEPALPLTRQPSEKEAGSSGALGAALVVEDDAGWRGILAELLADAGYRVRLCAGFGEALGGLRRDKPSLAVIDLSLAGGQNEAARKMGPGQELEGARLLVSLRAAGVPAIVVSGISNPAEIERMYQELGVFAYIEKQNFDRRNFLQAVQEVGMRRQPPGELDVLTDREREVLKLVGQGLTNKEIADRLVISTNTVKRHLKAIFEKLNIHTRSAAAAKAAESSND